MNGQPIQDGVPGVSAVFFFAADGRNTAPGTFKAPKLDLKGFVWPVEGDVLMCVETFHRIGDIDAPPGINSLMVSAYRKIGKKEQLPRLKSPWPANTWPVVGRITSTCATHLRHLHTNSVGITVTGKPEDEGQVGVTLQHVTVAGDLDLSGCQYGIIVPQFVEVTGRTTVARAKGGVIHFQHFETDELDVTDADCKLLTGSTHVYPDGKSCDPVDCCKYRVKIGKPKLTANVMLNGTGTRQGLLESAKGEKPEWMKGAADGS